MHKSTCKIRKNRKRTRKGSLLLVTIVSFAVMIMLGVALLGSVTAQYSLARRTCNNERALTVADAGINYAYWRQRWSRKDTTTINPLPLTHLFTPTPDQLRQIPTLRQKDDTLTIDNDATDTYLLGLPPVGSTPGYQIVSLGKASATNRAVRAIIYYGSGQLPPVSLDLPIFKHAIFSAADLTLNPHSDITGDVWCNGTFRGHKNTTISGQLSYGPSTLNKFVRTTLTRAADKLPPDQFVEIPDFALDPAHMPIGAGDPNSIVTNIGQSGKPTTYFTDGSITLPKLHVKGPTTIVILGDVTLDDIVADNPNQSDLLLISTGNVHMIGSTFNGYIYCHNADGNATFFGTNIDVNGAIIADDFKKLNAHCSVNYQPLNPTIFIPPGAGYTDVVNWRFASWELLY